MTKPESIKTPPIERLPPVLEMIGITKEFLGGRVLHGVDLALSSGEVHAIVGQNGAGKSTLIKILGGAFHDYGGVVAIDGASVSLRDPRQAKAGGIAVIYQDFTLVPQLTVAENIALGREPAGAIRGTIDYPRLRAEAARVAADLGIKLPINLPVAQLGVAAQQLTEIVKAVSRRIRILVMDEPTARLSAKERDRLFAIMGDLTAKGVGIIYVSHFLEEIFTVADRVTTLRDGHVIDRSAVGDLTLARLTELMTRGRSRATSGARTSVARNGELGLRLQGFGVPGRVGPVDLDISPGEIVGLAGLVGSGRTTLARAIVGTNREARGTVTTARYHSRPRTPSEAVAAGILLLTEDRKREGVVGVRSIAENISLAALGRLVTPRGFVSFGRRHSLVMSMIKRLGIVPADPYATTANLSGGNQQKVVLARAIAAGARFLILDQPTAGVDVGAKADIYEQIDWLARDGVGILLISDELDELLTLSDRIAVLRRGRIETIASAASYDRPHLLQAITAGGSRQ
jgi:ABC-type sugar transport system ATPase subunit